MYKNEKKILLVLDVDETLVHATDKELERDHDFSVYGYYVYNRPYLEDFLLEMSKYFLLGIWSSASDDYVSEVVKHIVPNTIDLEFVWGRSRCTYRRDFSMDESRYYSSNHGDHYHFIKPLKKLKRQGYQLEKILIVDDSPHKCQDNFGNAIYPREFTGDVQDDELVGLSKYLITLKDKENVRRIEKRFWRSSASK